MNVKYGVPVLFISCGIFVLLLNILGNRTSFKEPKPFHRNNSRKEGNIFSLFIKITTNRNIIKLNFK